ncbi:MAG: CRP/FNR family cyclic AMP-dependent transcriptional regulator [Maribacter sp.]|jgi:CRP/FNR family cyclic AMP-dependent transcriptional regulator
MINTTKFWFLKDFNLFKKMGKKSLMDMCHLLEMINVKKGETLYLNREDRSIVYFIKSGSIKIVNEQEHTRSILQRGNIFGELALYEEKNSNNKKEKAIVLEDGVVCVIEAEQMKMMIENHSSLKNQLLKLHGLRIRKLQRNLEDLLYKDSETRIKEFILNYINEFGKEKDGLLKSKNLLSHKDIAQLTNTSRQTASNVLSKLRKEGVIDYNSKEIFIQYSFVLE